MKEYYVIKLNDLYIKYDKLGYPSTTKHFCLADIRDDKNSAIYAVEDLEEEHEIKNARVVKITVSEEES